MPKILGFAAALAAAAGAVFLYLKVSAGPDYQSSRLGGFVSWDSHLYPGPTPPFLQWLDNDTVVYVGSMSRKPMSYLESSRLTEAIIIWRLGEAPVAYTDERWLNIHGNVCAADGVIVYPAGYGTSRNGKRVVKFEAGMPGHFHERSLEYQPDPGPFGRGDSSPCDLYDDPKMDSHLWIADHDRKFYLDFGSVGKWPPNDDPVMLLSPTTDKAAIALPVTRQQAIYSCTQYHRFSHLFYLEGCGAWGRNSFVDENCSHGYWSVDPNTAQTERHCVPFDPTFGDGWDWLLPTARGIFFSTSRNMTMSTVGISGLFEVDGAHSSPVVKGFVENPVVSPNGCRLAFSYAKALRDIVVGTTGEYSVVAIDVCQART